MTQTQNTSSGSVGPWAAFKKRYWVVEAHEGKKLYPLMAMMFLICFSYTLLRDLKDVMILELGSSEPISYLKLSATLPVSFIFMIVYTKMSITKSKPYLFYSFLGFFMAIFAVTMVLYTFRDQIEYRELHKHIKSQSVAAFVAALENWTIILIFVFAEMYGTVVLSLLFWGFANDICTSDEARRFYPLINLVANVALVVLGMALLPLNAFLKEKKHIFLYVSYILVIVFGGLVAYIYNWMQLHVLTDPVLYNPNLVKPKKKKAKMGLGDSLKFVFSSAYVAKIACMVIMYGMMVNFMEIYYKNVLKMQWMKETIAGKAIETCITGAMVIVLSLFIGGTAVKRFGWTKTAAVTPFVIGIFGLPFLVIQFMMQTDLKRMGALAANKTATVIVDPKSSMILPIYIFGFLTVVCAKSFKYSFFDPTKEMAYIPLDDEVRGRAKAAVDVVGARLGKSGSSAIFIILNGIFDTKNSLDYTHVILGMFCFGILTWFYSTISLGKDISKKQEEQKQAVKGEQKV